MKDGEQLGKKQKRMEEEMKGHGGKDMSDRRNLRKPVWCCHT